MWRCRPVCCPSCPSQLWGFQKIRVELLLQVHHLQCDEDSGPLDQWWNPVQTSAGTYTETSTSNINRYKHTHRRPCIKHLWRVTRSYLHFARLVGLKLWCAIMMNDANSSHQLSKKSETFILIIDRCSVKSKKRFKRYSLPWQWPLRIQ